MFKRGGILFLLLLFFGTFTGSYTQTVFLGDSIPTNEQYFRRGISDITNTLIQNIQRSPLDTFELQIPQSSTGLFLENIILTVFQEKSIPAKVSSPAQSATMLFQVQPKVMSVTYGEPFRISLFGSRVVERNVVLTLSALISRRVSGEVLFSGEKSWGVKDTLSWENVSQVENESFEWTVGKKNNVRWYDSYVEPVVIIGTAAIVVFLFFTIRSS